MKQLWKESEDLSEPPDQKPPAAVMFSVPDSYLQLDDDDGDLIDLPPEVLAAIDQVTRTNISLNFHTFFLWYLY